MGKIITLQDAYKLSKLLKNEGKDVTLVGGCFDIFHYGHFHFLKAARKSADSLFIALENDKNVQKLKGDKRPITPQDLRAEILSSFPFVDYVFLLPSFSTDDEYKEMTYNIKPAVIAVTKGDTNLDKKKMQAEKIGARLEIIDHINTPSSTELHRIITKEL